MSDLTNERWQQILQWSLQALAAIALTIGAYSFSQITTRLDRLSMSISGLERAMAVLEDSRERDEDIRDRLRTVEARVTRIEERLQR